MIVTGNPNQKTHGFFQKMIQDKSGNAAQNVAAGSVKREFQSIVGGRMTLTGWQILFLAKTGAASAILSNDTVEKTAFSMPTYNTQLWPWATGAPVDWVNGTPTTPTIAIVDSGIDATRARLSQAASSVRSTSTSLPGNTPRVTATATARSWRASPQARLPAMPASPRRRTSCPSTS